MTICIIFSIILLPILLFASTVDHLFTPDELNSMGICLAYTQNGLIVA
jgi:hypothetical protein